MKHTRIAALAALGLAASLSLTACGGDDSGTDTSSKGSSSSSSSKSEAGDAKADGAKAGSGSGSGSDTKAEAAGGGAAKSGGGKVTFCKTADLAIDAQDAAADGEGRIDITMINRGSTTCSATGFAGVDIKDEDNTSNPIERGQAQPRVTTLKPGDAAVFNLAYDIDTSGESLASPTNIIVTPPNETHNVTLDWP
ncbi:DUF4232 domain-containing protein, partial [Streptomyces kanamyceticus]